jgi:hypothetical protein
MIDGHHPGTQFVFRVLDLGAGDHRVDRRIDAGAEMGQLSLEDATRIGRHGGLDRLADPQGGAVALRDVGDQPNGRKIGDIVRGGRGPRLNE